MKSSLTLLALACGAANACAADFGDGDLQRQDRMVYEKSLTQPELDRLKSLTLAAMDNIAAFYGERRGATPDFYFCKSADCARFLLGPEFRSYSNFKGGKRFMEGQYWFENPSIVITNLVKSPKARDETLVAVLTHELSHIETYTRAAGHPIPAWFNEGLATMVGGKACKPGARGVDDLGKLKVMKDWLYYTRPSGGQGLATYCQATQEVQAWAERHGGARSLVELLAGLSTKSFAAQYGDFVTPPEPASSAAAAEENDR